MLNPYQRNMRRLFWLNFIVLLVSVAAFKLGVGANIPVFIIILTSFGALGFGATWLVGFDEDDAQSTLSAFGSGMTKGISSKDQRR